MFPSIDEFYKKNLTQAQQEEKEYAEDLAEMMREAPVKIQEAMDKGYKSVKIGCYNEKATSEMIKMLHESGYGTYEYDHDLYVTWGR